MIRTMVNLHTFFCRHDFPGLNRAGDGAPTGNRLMPEWSRSCRSAVPGAIHKHSMPGKCRSAAPGAIHDHSMPGKT